MALGYVAAPTIMHTLSLCGLEGRWRAGQKVLHSPRYVGLEKVFATEIWASLSGATLGLLLEGDRLEWEWG